MMQRFTLAFLFCCAFCSLATGQNYLMSDTLTTLTTCGGYFLDSGGSTGNYGPNENFTTTICPDLSSGTHVQLVFNATDIRSGDELCFYDGPDTSAPSLDCSSDFANNASFIIQATAANASGCITVTFTSNGSGQGAGWSADINCIPACQIIQAVIDSTYPAIEPADTGYIDICPGDRVFFFGKGLYPQNGVAYEHSDLTCSFEWDFGDGSTSSGPATSHVFKEPGGYIVTLVITDQLGCRNTNFIKQRVRVAPKPQFNIGEHQDMLCPGDTVRLNAMVDTIDENHAVSVVPVEGTFQTSAVLSDSLALPDGNGASYMTSVTFTQFAPGQTLDNIDDLLKIFVVMEHSWLRDLQIKLSCPNGQSVVLHNHAGQVGDEEYLGVPYHNDEGLPPVPGVGWEYGWSSNPDYDATWLEYVNTNHPGTLPSGTYRSYEPLTNLLGCPLNGDWTITVTDLWPLDNGFIFSWGIEFDSDLFPFLESFKPALTDWTWLQHPTLFYHSPDSIAGTLVNAGEAAYTFTIQDEFGCAWDTTVQIQVLPPSNPNCHACGGLIEPQADTTVCFEDSFQLDVSGAAAASPAVTFEAWENYPIGAANHPPSNPYLSPINVNSLQPAVLTNPLTQIDKVCLDLTTDFDGDIRLYLRAPNGQQLELSTGNGGSGDNYTNTCFSPVATVPITAGMPPFTGTFRPEGNWNDLMGAPVNGEWSLVVADAFGINNYGTLNWWTITFNTTNQVTYSWTPAAVLSCSDCPNPVVTPSSDVDLIVSASDSYGCQDTDTIHVAIATIFPAPVISCTDLPGGQMRFNWSDLPQGGISYLVNVNGTGWVPNNFGAAGHVVSGLSNGQTVDIQVMVNAAGTACEVEIGSASCTYSYCNLVASLPTPGPYLTKCAGACDGTLTIDVENAVAPLTFEAHHIPSGTTTTYDNSTLDNLCAGDYMVIVTDDVGCKDTITFSLGEPPPINLSAQQVSPPSCFNTADGCASAMASGGLGGFTYTWDLPNLPIGPNTCLAPAGPLTVMATDAGGCTVNTTIEITGPPPIELTLSADSVSCKGAQTGKAHVVTTGGAGNFTYQWSGGDPSNQPDLTGIGAGTYSVTVTDANGCTAEGSIAVGEPAEALQVTATQTEMGCAGSDQNQAAATVNGGTPPLTVTWQPAGQTGLAIGNLPPGPHIVLATDVRGCTATDTIEIQELPPIEISLIANPPTCKGDTDGEMAVNNVTGGSGNYVSYQWSTGATDPLITNLAGNVTYTVTITDSKGCTGSKSRILIEPLPLVVQLETTDARCAGEPSGAAQVVNVLNNQGPVIFQWDASAGGQTSPSVTGLLAGSYTVIATDSAGCKASATANIGEPAPIVVKFTVLDNPCYGYGSGAIDAVASGGVGGLFYNWSTGATTSKITNLPAGAYQLTVTDQNGCTLESTANVGQPKPIEANIEVKDVRCFGEKNGMIEVKPNGGTPPFRYSLDGNTYVGSPAMLGLTAGDYLVYIQDGKGCVAQFPASISQPPPFEVSILVNGLDTAMLMIPFGNELTLEATPTNGIGDILFSWEAGYCGTLYCDSLSDCEATPLCQTVTAKPNDSNNYWVLAIDEHGCEAEAHFQVHVHKERRVMVPTGFTPNGDGINDRLPVHGQSGTIIKLFRIFDRWGELLFERRDVPVNEIDSGWDGTFRGQPMPAGVYAWYLEVEYGDGMKETLGGQTTLIR